MTTFQAWLINVSNALENIRIHSELNRLVYKLEDMYIRDELTGLYNRRGLETLGEKYLKQAAEKKSAIMVFTADLDKLKYINDNYGHSGGDIALKAVANALSLSADDDEICARFGGDEFIVIGLEYDEEKAYRFIRGFVGELDRFNQNGKEEFSVYVSYGWNLVIPDINTTVEECLVTADKKMYQKKREKEALKLRANLIQ
jgi:diguanylate cyclase (GGDEF)-like protein